MARPKLEVFHKMCRKCSEIFETKGKYAKICLDCSKSAHDIRVRKNLLNVQSVRYVIPLTN